MYIVPVLITSAIAILIALSVWGFFGGTFFLSNTEAPLVKLDELREEAKNAAENESTPELRDQIFPLPDSASLQENQNIAGVGGATKQDHVRVQNSQFGAYLTDRDGRTLYTVSSGECNGRCLDAWPPYLAEGTFYTNGHLGIVMREDLRRAQFTWNGNPLYYYSGDTKSGDAEGDGVNGTWFIARP